MPLYTQGVFTILLALVVTVPVILSTNQRNSKMRVKKIRPLSLKSNVMVADPDGIYALISDIIEKQDYDCATVREVNNDNKDSGEADKYVIIECNKFQLQITLKEIEGLQERFDNEPHLRRHVPPKLKNIATGIPGKKVKGKKSE